MSGKSTSRFIPNSFQHPNAYIDEFHYLLTGDEVKVLDYAIRRIFGFNKRADRISIPQFCYGIIGEDGEPLDHGTGLSESTVKKCLVSLTAFGLMIRVSENDPNRNEGVRWGLELDSDKVDLAGLEKRKVGSDQLNKRRTEAALKKRGGVVGHTHPTSDIPTVVAQPHGGIVAQPHGGVVGQPTQYPVETQGNTDHAHAGTRDIQDAYCALLGYKPDDWSSGESKAAKSIAEHWTVEQLKRAYRHLKAQSFWRDKRVTLRYLKQQMPEILKSERGSHGSDSAGNDTARAAEHDRLQRLADRINARRDKTDARGASSGSPAVSQA